MPDRSQPSRRHLLRGVTGAAGVTLLAGCGGGGGGGTAARSPTPSRSTSSRSTSSPSPTPTPPPELPRGGRTIFPGNRLFGWCGTPAGTALGQLGIGNLDDEVTKMLARAPLWAGGEKVLPIMELIATIALSRPGADGLYRGRIADADVDTWLQAARRHRTLLLINIQPGRARFIDEVQHYERWLREPDVGLALDPEWAVGPGQLPGRVFGHTTGRVIDEVAQWLSGVVRAHDLPQKPLVYHVLRRSIISDEAALRAHPGVAYVKSVDGIGAPSDKEKTYHAVMRGTPPIVHAGFKLFFQEDAAQGPMMTPGQVLALHPRPDYVLFE